MFSANGDEVGIGHVSEPLAGEPVLKADEVANGEASKGGHDSEERAL